MIDARSSLPLAVLNNVEDDVSEIAGKGWGTDLVEDDLQGRFGCRKIQHSLDKIPAKGGIEPSRSDNDVLATRSNDVLLTMQLGQSIDARRSTFLVFLAGHIVGIGTKDIIGRNVYKQASTLLHHLSKILWSLCIQRLAKLCIRLCLIDIRICRTVDNDVHLFCFA